MYRNTINLPDQEQFDDPNNANQLVVNSIIQPALAAIPRTGTKIINRYCCFWWNNSCKETLDLARRQLRKLNKTHTPYNVTEYYRLNAIALQIIISSKRTSWREYLQKVNKDTPLPQLWRVFKSLERKPQTNKKIVIEKNNTIIRDPADLGEEFGKFFSQVSSNDNYSENFLLHKVEEEFETLVFPPSNDEEYNGDFILKDLKNALDTCKNTSPGEDDIAYEMLKKLPDIQLNKLLAYYKYLWRNDLFPDDWGTAIVLPFLKPNK